MSHDERKVCGWCHIGQHGRCLPYPNGCECHCQRIGKRAS